MSNLLNILRQQILPYIDKPFCIAYSGGVDSQVLLHGFCQLKKEFGSLKFSVCHVNHGLNENADKWQQFAIEQCQLLDVSIHHERVNLVKKPRKSLEALARDARYAVLDSTTQKDTYIVTGHHEDDQLETFFLALKRGSGIQGLSSMQTCSTFSLADNKTLFRPMLSITRSDIEQYAKEYDLDWIEDDSNIDESFDRNFIRHQITPLLKQRWPNISKNISRSASHCDEAQQLIDDVANADLKNCQTNAMELNIAALQTFSHIRQKHIVRLFLQRHNVLMPSEQQLAQLLAQISRDNEIHAQVKVGDKWLRQFKGKLHLTEPFTDVSNWRESFTFSQLSECDIDISLPDRLGIIRFSIISDNGNDEEVGQVFSLPQESDFIEVVFRTDNTKILPEYRNKRRELKKVWQELSVPSWLRKRIPLIKVDNELAVVANKFICQPFLPSAHQVKIKVIWLAQ